MNSATESEAKDAIEIFDFDSILEAAKKEHEVLLEKNSEENAEGVPTLKKDYGQKMIDDIEAEYRGMPDIKAEREKEKNALTEKLKKLKNKLKSVKNVKNHKRVAANAQASELRKNLRAQIEKVEDQLYQIKMEEEGSTTNLTKLTQQNILSPPKAEEFSPLDIADPSSFITGNTGKLFGGF